MKNEHEKQDKTDLIFGTRPLIEAINSGKEVEKIFIQKGLQNERFTELMQLLKQHQLPYVFVPVEKLNRFGNRNHQGVAAFISPIAFQDIEKILPNIFEEGKTPLILILDRITDVRNFGAIARTAECAGVHAIVLPEKGSANINADAVKTSAGALFKIPVCRSSNLKNTLDFLKDSGLQIAACTEKADHFYYDADLSSPLVIIMGSEENGISGEYLKRSDIQVKIPMEGTIQSLNVSVAAGIILFEAVKQRISKS